MKREERIQGRRTMLIFHVFIASTEAWSLGPLNINPLIIIFQSFFSWFSSFLILFSFSIFFNTSTTNFNIITAFIFILFHSFVIITYPGWTQANSVPERSTPWKTISFPVSVSIIWFPFTFTFESVRVREAQKMRMRRVTMNPCQHYY